MGSSRETRIRERAYQLWIEYGQKDGRADHHWEEASRLVDKEAASERPRGPAAAGEAADAAVSGDEDRGRG